MFNYYDSGFKVKYKLIILLNVISKNYYSKGKN